MKVILSSKFGAKESFRERAHTGVDIALEEGTPLKAAADGTIRLANYGADNAGKAIFLDTEDGKTFIYGHLSDFKVYEGQSVAEGQTIALSGNTGNVIGNGHLHLGLKENGGYVDPTPYAENVVNGSWWDTFISRGQIDEYGGFTFAELIQSKLQLIGLESIIIIGGMALLLLNRFTRPYTLAAVGLYVLAAFL